MIRLENISVCFQQKKQVVHAVQDVTLEIERGKIFGIVGYSGAGKSTLVRVINLLQKPTTGAVYIKEVDLTQLKPKELREQRKKIGMIFQHFHLMNARTVFDNVDFPLKHSGLSKEERQKKVSDLLELVGLADKHHAYPKQLSGGQKQRVAIARALANDPEILLCDEATSALDPKTTLQILELLQQVNQKLGLTIVLITHEMQVVKEICHEVAIMEDGRVIEQNDCVNIFAAPQQPLTQDFIRTATHLDQAIQTLCEQPRFAQLPPNHWLLELTYIGEEANEPLIVELFEKFQVKTNILYGNIEIIQQTPIGHLLITLEGHFAQLQKAREYLQAQGVKVKDIQTGAAAPISSDTIQSKGGHRYAGIR